MQDRAWGRRQAFTVVSPGFYFWLYHLLTTQLWASYLISLSLRFIFCKMGLLAMLTYVEIGCNYSLWQWIWRTLKETRYICLVTMTFLQDFLILATPTSILWLFVPTWMSNRAVDSVSVLASGIHTPLSFPSRMIAACHSFLPSKSLSCVLSSWIMGPWPQARPSWNSSRLPALRFPWVIHSAQFWPIPHRHQLCNDIPCCKLSGTYTRAGRKTVDDCTGLLVTGWGSVPQWAVGSFSCKL